MPEVIRFGQKAEQLRIEKWRKNREEERRTAAFINQIRMEENAENVTPIPNEIRELCLAILKSRKENAQRRDEELLKKDRPPLLHIVSSREEGE